MARIYVMLLLLCVSSAAAFSSLVKVKDKSVRFAATSTSIPFFANEVPQKESYSQNVNAQKTVVVAGATGYIGRAVVQESVRRGYNTVALVRNVTQLETEQARQLYGDSFVGATLKECNVQDPQELQSILASLQIPVDTVISCLASPSGIKKEAYAIDYQATLNCLEAGQRVNARHFVLLSAFCCRNPLLQLQQAKLKFEAELAQQSLMTWSVVRPTAFFKSVSGQLEAIRGGAPYVLFGDGAVTQCNPIAETELAEFMMDCLIDESKTNKIINVGGPDQPLSNQMLGEVRFGDNGGSVVLMIVLTCLFFYTDDVQSHRCGTKVRLCANLDFRLHYQWASIPSRQNAIRSLGGCCRDRTHRQVLCCGGYAYD